VRLSGTENISDMLVLSISRAAAALGRKQSVFLDLSPAAT